MLYYFELKKKKKKTTSTSKKIVSGITNVIALLPSKMTQFSKQFRAVVALFGSSLQI